MVPVAVLPVLAAGWSAFVVSRQALEKRTRASQVATARNLAERVAAEVGANRHAVALAAQAMEFGRLQPEETTGAMRLVFRQIEGAAAVALLSTDGRQLVPPVYLPTRAEDPALADRPAMDAEDIALFGRSIPLRAAVEIGSAVGPAHASPAGDPRVAVAVRARGGPILAVELSLARLVPLLSSQSLGVRGRAVMVDRRGRTLLSARPEEIAAGKSRMGDPLVRTALQGGLGTLTFTGEDGLARLGAAAEVPDLGWVVAVDQPESDALAEAGLLARALLIALAAALAGGVALALLASGAIVRPIRALHKGAAELAAGRLGYRVEGTGRNDELGGLARGFNAMAAEIERWNQELAQRVEEKTREAREAQDLLLRVQKLAAVGQLGAGIAHEINNPLTGVLGMTQLLLAEERDMALNVTPRRKKLEAIEKQAQRIGEIVARVHRIAEGDDATLQPVDLATLLEESIAHTDASLASAGVRVIRDFGPPLRVLGDPRRLTEAFSELISNARRAMPSGGQITIGYKSIEGQLAAVRFADTGEGISPQNRNRIFEPFFTTKQDWNAKGLGLSMVHQVCEAHNGRVTVESQPGKGSIFTVMLPLVQARVLA